MAAHALLTDELVGQRIPLTGPQALTNSELAEVIGAVLGRPLRYQEAPTEIVRQRFIGLGFPAEFADAYWPCSPRRSTRPPLVTPDVEEILGRPALSFADMGVPSTATVFTTDRSLRCDTSGRVRRATSNP